jgi:hypothetical protein
MLPNNPLAKLDLVSIQLMFLLDSFEVLSVSLICPGIGHFRYSI